MAQQNGCAMDLAVDEDGLEGNYFNKLVTDAWNWLPENAALTSLEFGNLPSARLLRL